MLHNKETLLQNGWTKGQLQAVEDLKESTFDDEIEYECADNFRIARENNPEECSEYQESESNGCCGFYDTVIEHPDGNILFGFNYGH